jgi:hypothetical protein
MFPLDVGWLTKRQDYLLYRAICGMMLWQKIIGGRGMRRPINPMPDHVAEALDASLLHAAYDARPWYQKTITLVG